MITAYHEEDALQKATTIGRQEEEVFYNDRQQLVQWKFIDIAELHTLNHLMDGAELYSQIKETDDPEGYGSFIRHKASMLREKHTLQTLQTA